MIFYMFRGLEHLLEVDLGVDLEVRHRFTGVKKNPESLNFPNLKNSKQNGNN